MRRPPGYSRSTRLHNASKRKKDRVGYTIMAASAAALALLGITAATGRSAKVDKTTGCPLDHHAPVAHTVILIDETDQLNRDELAYAKALVLNEYHWLPLGGRLTVRNIVADPDQGEDIVVCRMNDGSASSGLTSNPKMERAQFEKVAGARLNQLYASLSTAAPQDYSPLLESIAAAANRPNFGGDVAQRRLVILSDMAQHSEEFSQYGGKGHLRPPPEAAEEFKPDLKGVEVRIHYVQRHKLVGLQGTSHRNFWTGYLHHLGAGVAIGHNLRIGEEPSRETWSE